jgi:hypothetical protein
MTDAFIDSSDYVDGNALGGTLREVFAVDITGARGRCAGCGTVNMVATSHVYVQSAGAVARCASCGDVLIRIVSAPDRMFLDFRGMSFLEITLPAGA